MIERRPVPASERRVDSRRREPVDRAGQAIVLRDAHQVHFGQRGVPRSPQPDLRILDLQARLPQIRPLGQGFGKQILDGPDSSFSGISSASVGMMVAACTSGSALPVRVSRFFRMACCSSSTPRALIRSWRVAKTWALARVISTGARVPSSTCALVSEKSFSAAATVSCFTFTSSYKRHEIRVQPDHAIYRGDQLLVKQQRIDLAVVVRDTDEPPVQRGAEAPQQGLCNGHSQAGSGVRIVVRVRGIQVLMGVIERHVHLRTGGESIHQAGVGVEAVGDQRGHAVGEQIQLRRALVHPVQLADQGRIENGNRRARGLGNRSLNRQIRDWLAQRAQFQRVGGDCRARRTLVPKPGW